MPEPVTNPLSEGLKARIADFYATTTFTKWWHDPRYLELTEAISQERNR